MEEKYLCRIEAAGQKYYLMTSWENDDVDQLCKLFLTDGQSAWHTVVTDGVANRLARSVQMDLHEYLKQTKKAFTANSSANSNFHFGVSLLPDHNTVEFAWKKYLRSEDMKFQLGKLKMAAVTDPKAIISELFDFSLSQISNLKMNIASLNSTNERLSSERAESLKNLEEFVVTKENLEVDMYGKFIRVLNSKKNKIRTLTNQVRNMPTFPTSVKMEEKIKVEKEEEDDLLLPGTSHSGPGTSSTSTENENSLPSSSLMLEDTVSNICVAPTAKRRKRRGAAIKSDADDLPALPKTRSLRKNSSQLSRNNSTGSNSSQGRLKRNSSALPGAEDLMEEI
ncbi:uncharacterized protein TRIADDRAFT_52000 [Trichoplax adhaerens]|uniref:DNA repair protein XRCC4 n=1 Tax=Trichoplax adhaerens TaxID=10228 RepID=B3RLH3_TRIAD|nr:hypothetical protein TRIADDRAFT_52000 [Trichoplax adhaerens]EDV29537.1 hypothetical protein TRIADDRAFT_52000 [Trichoplax adhaerens]|eukprot:XP_002108739.1 hypothetical protein TRIADDRAFT_52000 [Trichoplax adhaerens]